jgi:hypothetical protein
VGACPIPRVARVLLGLEQAFESHAEGCGDRVVAIALHPSDHESLWIVEIWGLPVLAWDDVAPGQLKLLCDAAGVLVPEVHSVDDLLEQWAYFPAHPDASVS